MRSTAIAILFVSSICTAQPPQTVAATPVQATTRDLQYVRFIILNIASLDHSSQSIQDYENSLVKLFGLGSQESTAIHNAATNFKPVLSQYRQSAQAIIAGRSALSQSDLAALADVDTQREQAILNVGNQILNSVSPAVAARLLNAANFLALVKNN